MDAFETPTSGLGVFLPEPASEIVNVWRRRYDPSFEFWAPHITLIYPPFVMPDRWPEIRPVIAACLAPFGPFEVSLKELGMFTVSPYVLWLKPDDGGVLIRMRRALEAALPELVPPLPFPYQPHVSIGFFQDLESLQQAYEEVHLELAMLAKEPGSEAPIRFRVDEICYGYQDLNQRRHIYDRIRLASAPESEPGGEPKHASTH